MHSLRLALADGAVIAKRNLIKVKRVPDVLVFTTLSPIMFVLLFAYVFGNSIDVPGVNYREFLIAGIFAQTVVFGATFTDAGLAEDIQKGIIDRFRSLPMATSSRSRSCRSPGCWSGGGSGARCSRRWPGSCCCCSSPTPSRG
jgi:hypothetical protein